MSFSQCLEATVFLCVHVCVCVCVCVFCQYTCIQYFFLKPKLHFKISILSVQKVNSFSGCVIQVHTSMHDHSINGDYHATIF